MKLALIGITAGALMMTAAAPQQSALSGLIPQLVSGDWKLRAQAVEQIAKAPPAALEDPQLRSALLSTLDRENVFVRSTLRALQGQMSLEQMCGEAYGEYYSTLLGIVDQYADYDDPPTIRVVVRAMYNPDSNIARKLARHVDVFLPILIEDANSDVLLVRMSAVDFITQILHKFRPRDLTAEGASQLMQVLTKRAGSDEDPGVRRQAQAALRSIADINGDKKVDCADLRIVMASVGKRSGDMGFDARADIGFRQTVGAEDVAYVSQYLPEGARCRQ